MTYGELLDKAAPRPSVPVLPPIQIQSDYTSASTTPATSPEGSGTQAHGDAGIRSDITAWQSALQALPPEFANAKVPEHPLSLALINQPSLRPVEWNPYRQQGGFVPRTAHDYSSLMIYVSGQINPNPCRRCRLRNGPFAQCIVSPPIVLGNSAIRHACANCTYQCQYSKCTNEPISEQERLRVELLRSVMRTKKLTPRQPMSRQPNVKDRADRPAGKKSNPREQSKQERVSDILVIYMKRGCLTLWVSGYSCRLGLRLTNELIDQKSRQFKHPPVQAWP